MVEASRLQLAAVQRQHGYGVLALDRRHHAADLGQAVVPYGRASLIQTLGGHGGQELEVLAPRDGSRQSALLGAAELAQPAGHGNQVRFDLDPRSAGAGEVAPVRADAVADVDHGAGTAGRQGQPGRDPRLGVELPRQQCLAGLVRRGDLGAVARSEQLERGGRASQLPGHDDGVAHLRTGARHQAALPRLAPDAGHGHYQGRRAGHVSAHNRHALTLRHLGEPVGQLQEQVVRRALGDPEDYVGLARLRRHRGQVG